MIARWPDPADEREEPRDCGPPIPTGAKSHESRRELLACLCEKDGAASIPVLADRLAKVERRPLAVSIRSLYDCHLPWLVDHDIVDHDADDGTVTLRVDPGRLAEELLIDR